MVYIFYGVESYVGYRNDKDVYYIFSGGGDGYKICIVWIYFVI